jgi:predicted ATP-grasp superfamily ATP-dependent carboligase/SAM-dependent methyltransferase
MALIPCTDQWVAAVAGLDPALTARFPASVAPPETIQILLDKGRFAEAAARLGVPHPRTICLNPQDDPATLPEASFQGAFLKPRNAKAFLERYGVKATRFTTRSEAIVCMLEARRAGLELMLQEDIPGPATRHYYVSGFVDRNGTECASFAFRWLRRHPQEYRGFGGAYGVSIPLEEMSEAVQAVRHLLGALRYRGVFNAQFKYDERDGRFKILEVNARPWIWVDFAIACGVDVVEMAYRDALGLPVQPVTEYEIGRYTLDPFTDLIAGWRLLRERQLTPWTWLRSWPGATQLIFTWDDPVPAVVSFFDVARRIVRRRLRGRRVRQGHPPVATTVTSKKNVKALFTGMVEKWASYYAKPVPASLDAQRLVSRKRFAIELLEASVSRGARVLDVGCATGDLTEELTRRGYDALGIDISEAMTEYAGEHYGRDRFRVGDIEQMPFPDNSFDAVMCLGVVAYLETDVGALREIRRVLKPGGRAVITTPSLVSPFHYVDRLFERLKGLIRPLKHRWGGRPLRGGPDLPEVPHRRYVRPRWFRLLRSLQLEPEEWVCHGWGWYSLEPFLRQGRLCRASDRFARVRALSWLGWSQLVRVRAIK